MTLDEYKAIAGGLTTDNAPDVVTQILSGITTDLEALNTATNALAEKDKRIAELQDTNMKLFLSVTGKAEAPEEPEEKTPEQLRLDLINEIGGK